MEPQLTLWGSFILGLVYGVGPCLGKCVPFMLSYVGGKAGSRKTGWMMAAFFGSGRLMSNLLLGVAAAILGGAVQYYFLDIEGIIDILVGALSIILGVNTMGYLKPMNQFTKSACAILKIPNIRYEGAVGSLSLGFLMGFTPCGPHIVLLGAVLAMGNIAMGVVMILAFSIGTMVPLIPMGWLTGRAVELFKRAQLIKKVCGSALVLFGVLLIIGQYI